MQNAKCEMELELEPVELGEQKPPEHTCPTKLLESDWRRNSRQKTENRSGKLKTENKLSGAENADYFVYAL